MTASPNSSMNVDAAAGQRADVRLRGHRRRRDRVQPQRGRRVDGERDHQRPGGRHRPTAAR